VDIPEIQKIAGGVAEQQQGNDYQSEGDQNMNQFVEVKKLADDPAEKFFRLGKRAVTMLGFGHADLLKWSNIYNLPNIMILVLKSKLIFLINLQKKAQILDPTEILVSVSNRTVFKTVFK